MPYNAIIHKSPISSIINSGEKYTIYFIGTEKSGNRIIKHKTISEIAAELKESGNALADFGVDIALSAILKDFERKELLYENNDMDLTGFFIDDENKNIIASDIVTEKPTPAMVTDALKCVEEIKKYYEGRLDLLATIICWGIVAPISFLLKQNGSPFLNWLVFWGFTNATKSSTGNIVLAIDGHHNDSDYVLGAGSIDTIARLGDTISKTTFPKLVDEVNLDSISMKVVVENMKTAIESKICRTKFMSSKDRIGTRIPALSPLILTSNSTPPIHNSAFMRRIIDRSFPQSESRVKANSAATTTEFEEFMRVNLDKLKGLGRFRNWFVINNQDVILDKKTSPLELDKKILNAAYEHAGLEMPEWFNERLPQKQLEESLSDNQVRVKHAFVAYINTNFERALAFFRANEPDGQSLSLPDQISGRLVRLIDNKLLPGLTRDDKNNMIIYSGVLEELYKFGATRDQIPNLRALADYLGADYARIHPGNKVVKCTGKHLEDYFDKVVGIEGDD